MQLRERPRSLTRTIAQDARNGDPGVVVEDRSGHQRLVSQVVQDELGVVGARVKAQDGGKRGLLVTVQLPPAAQLAKQRVQEALASFLFEAEVTLG